MVRQRGALAAVARSPGRAVTLSRARRHFLVRSPAQPPAPGSCPSDRPTSSGPHPGHRDHWPEPAGPVLRPLGCCQAGRQVLRQAREQVAEDAVLPPLLEPPMAGLVRQVAIRQVMPRRAGALDPQHPVEHRTRVAPRAAAAVRARFPSNNGSTIVHGWSVRSMPVRYDGSTVTVCEKTS